jgi:hypothetical protein
MKLQLGLSLLLFSLTVQAAPKAQKGCSFIRHHHVEVEGKDIPKELRNKILNDFNPDKVVVQKTNEELNIKLCASFRPFKHLKDVPLSKQSREEHLISKVTLTPDEKGFWVMKVENLMRKNDKETTPVTSVQTYVSAESIKEIKDVEVVEWVSTKLLVLTNQ